METVLDTLSFRRLVIVPLLHRLLNRNVIEGLGALGVLFSPANAALLAIDTYVTMPHILNAETIRLISLSVLGVPSLTRLLCEPLTPVFDSTDTEAKSDHPATDAVNQADHPVSARPAARPA
jgi:hypothetical protein